LDERFRVVQVKDDASTTADEGHWSVGTPAANEGAAKPKNPMREGRGELVLPGYLGGRDHGYGSGQKGKKSDCSNCEA